MKNEQSQKVFYNQLFRGAQSDEKTIKLHKIFKQLSQVPILTDSICIDE